VCETGAHRERFYAKTRYIKYHDISLEIYCP
jgi:hypothetical protein